MVVKSTLAFKNRDGHRYEVDFGAGEPIVVNYNHNLNEAKENIYDIFYPTVARRVVEKTVELPVATDKDGYATLTLRPIDEGTVFEKIVVDLGAYTPQYLYGTESSCSRN